MARAIEEYEAAVREDPRFAEAFARIALAYGLYLGWGWQYADVAPESLFARGLAATERVLRENPRSSDAWVARAMLLKWRAPRTYQGVGPAFERAIELDPRNAEAHHLHGATLRELGPDSLAAAAVHRALAIDPERAVSLYILANIAWNERRYAEARRWLDSAVAVDPGFHYAYAARAFVGLWFGETAEARRDAETALRLSAGYPVPGEAALAMVDAHAGDTVAAGARIDRVLRDIVNPNRPTDRDAWWLGMALVALGDQDRALALLERVPVRGAWLWSFLRGPEFDSVRSDPRFQRLVAESRPR